MHLMKTCQGQLSSQSRTPCICYVWSDLSEICNVLLQIAAKPGYVQSWLILQIKAEFKSIDLHHLLVCYIFCIKHNGPTLKFSKRHLEVGFMCLE